MDVVTIRSAPDGAPGRLPRRLALQAGVAAGLAVPLARAGGQASVPESGVPQAQPAAEPVIAHVRNARTGEIDIFRGETQTRVHDRELAALLTRAAR